MRTKIDAGTRTFLALCECGWRSGIHSTRLGAATAAVDHERRTHPGDKHATDALKQYVRRQRSVDGMRQVATRRDSCSVPTPAPRSKA